VFLVVSVFIEQILRKNKNSHMNAAAITVMPMIDNATYPTGPILLPLLK
jgi:hypothetical protein